METQNNSVAKKPRAKRVAAPVVVESTTRKKPFFMQGTTWAGILSIGAAIAAGGASALADPVLLQTIGAGIALLIAEN